MIVVIWLFFFFVSLGGVCVGIFFFFQAEDGIRDRNVTGVQRVLFRSVCWATPGMDGTGSGSPIPSLTNRGSIRSDPRTVVRAASLRSAAVRRRRRGRAAGNPPLRDPGDVIAGGGGRRAGARWACVPARR